MKQWREFERLAARIYESLVPQGAAVRHDDRIWGQDSNIERQIDISIRFEVAGHEFLTVVDSKDLSAPADVRVVEEFAGVVEDVRANKGVLICRSGFSETALRLARKRGIDACNVHDAQSKKWALAIRVPIVWVTLLPTITGFGTVDLRGGDRVPVSVHDWIISPDGGKTRCDILADFGRLWNDGALPREIGQFHNVRDPSKSFQIRVQDSSGEVAWRDLDLNLTYVVQRRAWLGSFSPDECTGLLHYEGGRFVGSFPASSLPVVRDDEWLEIEDPEALAGDAPGSIVILEGWQIDIDSATNTGTQLMNTVTGDVIRPNSKR